MGSGSISRRPAGPFRGIGSTSSGARLGPVLGAGLLPVPDPGRVQRRPDDLVPDTREVLHPASPDQDDGVFLQVVPDTGDVGGDLHPGGQADPGYLAKGGVRLLRGGGVDTSADATTLGRAPERGALRLRPRALSPVSDQLVYCRHGSLVCNLCLPSRGIDKKPDRSVGPGSGPNAAFPCVLQEAFLHAAIQPQSGMLPTVR